MNLNKVLGLVKNVLAILAPSLKSPDSTHGVKELREAVRGVLAVSIYLIGKFKDGVQFTDFVSFYTDLTTDEAFKKVLSDAYEGSKQIKHEVKDADAGEGLEVLGDVIDQVDEIVAALNTEPAEAPAAPVAEATEAPAADTTEEA